MTAVQIAGVVILILLGAYVIGWVVWECGHKTGTREASARRRHPSGRMTHYACGCSMCALHEDALDDVKARLSAAEARYADRVAQWTSLDDRQFQRWAEQ